MKRNVKKAETTAYLLPATATFYKQCQRNTLTPMITAVWRQCMPPIPYINDISWLLEHWRRWLPYWVSFAVTFNPPENFTRAHRLTICVRKRVFECQNNKIIWNTKNYQPVFFIPMLPSFMFSKNIKKTCAHSNPSHLLAQHLTQNQFVRQIWPVSWKGTMAKRISIWFDLNKTNQSYKL